MADADHSNSVSLEKLTPLSPKGTPTLPTYPGNLKMRQVKAKKAFNEDGDRISSEEVVLVLGEDDGDREVRMRQKVRSLMGPAFLRHIYF